MTNATSFLLGSVVTLICAAVPFILSSRQLIAETKRLRTLSNLILSSLEAAGIAECRRDSAGEIVGIIISATGSSTGRSSATAVGEAVQKSK